MRLPIASTIENSLLDYPGKISYVVFLSGCNFKCGYCHNGELIRNSQSCLSMSNVLSDIVNRKKFIDGVVVTGGEPTIHADLPKFLAQIKDAGLPVKLDTNGSDYITIEALLYQKLVDFIALDIKGPLSHYPTITNSTIDPIQIVECLQIIKQYAPDYEVRTTMVPEYIPDNAAFKEICSLVQGCKTWALQQFNNKVTLNASLAHVQPYSLHKLHKFSCLAKDYVDNVLERF